jgi:hypothetical protein
MHAYIVMESCNEDEAGFLIYREDKVEPIVQFSTKVQADIVCEKLNTHELFEEHTIITREGVGWTIKCSKGEWSISGTNLMMVRDSAFHYFKQYYADGVYDED